MRILAYIVLFGTVAGSVNAEPNPVEALAGMRKHEKPLAVEDVKKIAEEAEHKLLTEEPKDASQAAMAVNKCIENSLSQQSIQDINGQNRTIDQRIKEFCKARQEAEARDLWKQYATQFAASAEYQAMKACVDKYKGSFYEEPAFEATRRSMAHADVQKRIECKKKAG